MLPDWYLRLSAESGPAFIPSWSNADVAAVALIAFAIFFLVGTILMADWPGDVAFLSLVAGGILVAWPAMIAITLVAVVLAMAIGGVHAVVAPKRVARIEAEARQRVAPAIDAFAREAGLSEEERRHLLDDDERKQRP